MKTIDVTSKMNYTHKREAMQERSTLTVTVQAARESLGWLQKDLANRANVSKSTVWRAENEVPIRRLYANRIAIALGIPLAELEMKIIKSPDEEP